MKKISTAKKAQTYLIRSASVLASVAVSVFSALPSWAGSFFVTGLDPNYHAIEGPNIIGARNYNQTALDFVTDPEYNQFAANGVNKFLYVESKFPPPPGHLTGVNGLIASGYELGEDFDYIGAPNLNEALDQLGTTYNAIYVSSDYGSIFSQDELNILNARSEDIAEFLNSGGGIYVASESNLGAGLTPEGNRFNFLQPALNIEEVPYRINTLFTGNPTVTPFAQSLGLTTDEVENHYYHNYFEEPFGGLEVVSQDESGNILSVAGRLPDTAVSVPESSSVLGVLAVGAVGAGALLKRKQKQQPES